jgi:predicted RNase H-like HicB family nuclease
MQFANVVIERDPSTGLLVAHIPGWPGAHTQAETVEELDANLEDSSTTQPL